MRQRLIGDALVAVGLSVLVLGLVANGAQAGDQTPYQDKVTSIEGARSYNAETNQTTFTFNATFSEQVSHITIATCPEGGGFVSASGPSGTNQRPYESDPSIGHGCEIRTGQVQYVHRRVFW